MNFQSRLSSVVFYVQSIFIASVILGANFSHALPDVGCNNAYLCGTANYARNQSYTNPVTGLTTYGWYCLVDGGDPQRDGFCPVSDCTCSLGYLPAGASTAQGSSWSASGGSGLMCGSIIQVDNNVVGETIDIVGTPFSLYYFSDRVPGRSDQYTIKTPIIGSTVDPDMTSVSVVVNVAGGTFNSGSLTIAADLTHSYTWDGKDNNGNEMIGAAQATSTIYSTWSSASDIPSTQTITLGAYQPKAIGLGGWTISAVHFYDQIGKRVYFGYGGARKVEAEVINTNEFRVPSGDASEVFEFDSTGRHVRTRHGLTGSTLWTFNYDSAGRLITLTDAYNNQTTINRSSGNITGITSPYSQTTSATLNSNGYLASVTNPNDEVREMTYSSSGLLQTFKKGKLIGSTVSVALTSTFTYDSEGKLLTDTNSALPSNTYVAQLLETYSSTSQRTVQHTSAEGIVTSFTRTFTDANEPSAVKLTKVDANGYSAEQEFNSALEKYTEGTFTATYNKTADARFQDKADFVSTSTYAPLSQQAQVVNRSQSVTYQNPSSPDIFGIDKLTVTEVANWDYSNRTSTSVFDGVSKTFTTTTPAGRTYVETINTYGLPTQVSYGTFYPVSLSYDTKGRVSGISQNTRSVSVTYGTAGTANGRLLTITNPLSQTTTFAYDSAGRVTTQTLPDTRQIGFSYDNNGNIATVTPPGRPAHSLSVNVLDLLTGYTAPTVNSQTPTVSYSYDNDKRLTSVTRPNGEVVSLSYGTSSYSHGKLESVGTPQGTISYGWTQWYPAPVTIDSFDNIRLSNSYSGNWITEQVVTDTLTSSGLGTVSLALNNDILQESETVTPPSGQGSAVTINYSYDNDGLMTAAGAITFGRNTNNGTVMSVSIGTISESRTHNQYGENMGKTVKKGTTTRYSYTLTRDAVGRVATKSENMNGTTTTYSYTYDFAGRLTDVSRSAGGNSSHTYDSNGNRTSGTTKGVAYVATYDNQDRVLTFGSNSYVHNLNGERTSITNTTTSVTINSTFDALGNLRSVAGVSYLYDGYGRRVAKLVNGAVQERYLYRNQLQIAAITNSSGKVLKRFVYAGSYTPEYFVDYNPTTNAATSYRLVTDHIGSVRLALKTTDGSVAQQIEYDEWGRVTSNSNPSLQPFTFAGGIYDPTTKLVHFGARDYDADSGRWIKKDPIGFEGGDTNLYGYVLQDPINWTDPTGLTPREVSLPVNEIGRGGGGVVVVPIPVPIFGTGGFIDWVRSKIANAFSKKGPSVNQINESIKNNQAPNGVESCHNDHNHGDRNGRDPNKDHIHLDNGPAINRDGTWRDGNAVPISNPIKKWLTEIGWKVPE